MKLNTKYLRSRTEATFQGKLASAYGVLLVRNIILAVGLSLITQLGSLALFGGSSLSMIFDNLKRIIALDQAGALTDAQIFKLALEFLPKIPKILIGLFTLNFVLKALFAIFIKEHFVLGSKRWFSRNREQNHPASFDLLFSLFRKENYAGVLKGMFWKNFKLFLWRLPRLFGLVLLPLYLLLTKVIPLALKLLRRPQLASNPEFELTAYVYVGTFALLLFAILWSIVLIIKRLEYHFVDWLLADQAQLDPSEAIKLSREMAKGHKWLICKVHLRYLIYHILASLSLLFYYFLKPLINSFKQAMFAELYAIRRDQMVAQGRITMEDLGYRLAAAPVTTIYKVNQEEN
ncbi:MAG: DUF975 family protein [Eubacteriales bacterium]|nr:DUF975 family protein [Eubacteriales bacterium]